ncbi:MAG: hypothetical protein ACLF0G_03870 [Candidatus Brocadiia bacterium]
MRASLLCASIAVASPAAGATALGDWGHFLTYGPRIHLHNPRGEAFSFTVHLMRWTFPGAWNRDTVPLRLVAPGGETLLEGTFRVEGTGRRFEVPAGAAGTYLLDVGKRTSSGYEGLNLWVESSLPRSVVWTGEPRGHAVVGRWLVVQPSVPRRYWFWVPMGTRQFTCRAQAAARYMSQREDWGITVFSPRGQRIRRLWGETPRDEAHGTMTARVPVEAGAAGRFWSVEIRLADSHNYANINFSLDGVPPYLARSPEEWFDPVAGGPPEVPLYDASRFMQEPIDKSRVPHHWSPCPALGDPDGVQVRGEGQFALWNPENRELELAIGNYLPRHGLREPQTASVSVRGPGGEAVLVEGLSVAHRRDGTCTVPRAGPGVHRVAVSGMERWYAYTYPATPLVWLGRELPDGWRRFTFEVGTARNWYLLVPRGTKSFKVRVAAQHETDVVHLEVNAPDRTAAVVYARAGERTVAVPAGLDGRLWHLRADVGSATRMITPPPREESSADEGPGGAARYLGIYLTLDLQGVPGYLAPTWEQWFDPQRPAPPWRRGRQRQGRRTRSGDSVR